MEALHRVLAHFSRACGRVTLAAIAVPSGLAAAGGNLWAADFAAGTVFQLVAGGVTLSPPITVAAGLN